MRCASEMHAGNIIDLHNSLVVNRWIVACKNRPEVLYEQAKVALQWIQILCGVSFRQISRKWFVGSTRGLQRLVRNWKIDNFIFLPLKSSGHMTSSYRDICTKVTPQSIWIHCRQDDVDSQVFVVLVMRTLWFAAFGSLFCYMQMTLVSVTFLCN